MKLKGFPGHRSAYALAFVGAAFDVVAAPPTMAPSYAPTIPPTYAPSIKATPEPTPRPTVPAPTAAPVVAPTSALGQLEATWYKNGDPAKDCAWVANLPDPRCDVKGYDGSLASEACATACSSGFWSLHRLLPALLVPPDSLARCSPERRYHPPTHCFGLLHLCFSVLLSSSGLFAFSGTFFDQRFLLFPECCLAY